MIRINKNISSVVFKCRGLFWGVFALGVLAFPASFGPVRFALGAFLVISGQALRLWAAGYIPKYRTEVIIAPVLVTWGPYKWVRNPLYAGNFIMGLGWALMIGWTWVAVFTAAFLLLYCLIVIPAEEEFLSEKFGNEYKNFRRAVPPLFPFPRNGFPEKSEFERPFDSKASWTEEIYSIRVNVIVTTVILVKLYLSVR